MRTSLAIAPALSPELLDGIIARAARPDYPAFEAQLRAYLRERFGNAWFTRREAGSLLRELWEEGQKPTADELLREVTGETLELAAVGDRVREALAAA